MHRTPLPAFLLLMVVLLALIAANLLIGSVSIPAESVARVLLGLSPRPGDAGGLSLPPIGGSRGGAWGEWDIWQHILLKSRLPQALTATVAGAGLSVSGLQMQTLFRNPLAGPSVLGISNGASLGVALVVLLSGSIGGVALSRMGYVGDAAIAIAAIVGALAIMALIAYISQIVNSDVTLLIIGVMIGYLSTAVIGVLKFFSPEEDVKAFVVWGLGSFARVSGGEMGVFLALMVVLLPLSLLLIKPLNLLLLGDNYAHNLGLPLKRAKLCVILSSGTLAAIVTAYCGPLMFIGLAVPHLARGLFRTADHRTLLPACMLLGALLALLCNLLARLPGFEGALPVNSVTALLGAPVIAYVLLRRRRGAHS